MNKPACYRSFSHTALTGLAAAVLCLAGPAQAEQHEALSSPLRISGYGTLAHSWDDQKGLGLMRDISQRPQDFFATDSYSSLDSRIGVQLNYQLSPKLSVIGQIVARDQVSDSLDHYIELAHLNIDLNANAQLRLGRFGYDAFLMSDHRNLGYSYAWMRPAIEFYGWVPIFSVDGIDYTHTLRTSDANWRLRLQAGRNDFITSMGANEFHFHAKNLWTLSLQREAGPWRFKAALAGHTSSKGADSLANFYQGLTQIADLNLPDYSSEAALLGRETDFSGVRTSYVAFGAAYDDEDWFGQFELAEARTTATFSPQSRNAYAVIGHRFGNLTPFAMLGISRPGRDRLKPINNWSALGPAAARLQGTAYHIVNSTRVDQETLSLGLRWDFSSNAALKLQLDHTRIHPNGYAAWFRDMALNTRASRVNLLTIGMDFVF
jgi:hypothetical protein